MRKLSGYGPSLIVLATAVLVLFLGPSAVQQLTYKQTEARRIQAVQRLETNDILQQINQAYRDIATSVEPSVVHISAAQTIQGSGGRQSLSSGSGWIYDADGHVVTNYHVVREANRIEVQLSSGALREATVIGFDELTDIAVLSITSGRLHPAQLGDIREPVKQGDLVFAFGSPFDFRFSMSSGVVSGKGRSVGVIHDDAGHSGYEYFIQVDAAINPGNSGGPLTDFRGRVIGMNTAIATGGRGNSLEDGQFAGIGLAIPLEMIVPAVSQIIENGVVVKGLLGVYVDRLDVSVAQRYGFIGSGAVVTGLQTGFPAETGGVEVGDIIMEINGKPVASPNQLQSLVSSILPGEIAELSIWRPNLEHNTGETLRIAVRLERLDPLREYGRVPSDQSTERIPQIGIAEMSTATPELASQYGAEYKVGVTIQRLVPNSALSRYVVPGTTIIAVGNYGVEDVDGFLEALRHYDLLRGVQARVVLPNGREEAIPLRARQQE